MREGNRTLQFKKKKKDSFVRIGLRGESCNEIILGMEKVTRKWWFTVPNRTANPEMQDKSLGNVSKRNKNEDASPHKRDHCRKMLAGLKVWIDLWNEPDKPVERGIGPVVSMETVAWVQPQLMTSLNHRLPEAEITNTYYSRDCFMFLHSLNFLLIHQLL